MKKILSLLLVVAMMLSVVACAANKSDDISKDTANQTETGTEITTDSESDTESDTEKNEPEAEHYPLSVTDQAGRTVTIEEEPQKLVSGYYISTSLLIALDLDDKLVGIEAKADKRPIYSLAAPELTELPSVGTAKEFDIEGCAALEPDLVILPLKLKNAADTLESLGIDVLLVNPENRDLLVGMIELIADATDTEEKAERLLSFTKAQENNLTKRLKNVKKPSVYLAGNSGMLSTAGNAMYQSDMISIAGGINAAEEITDSYWVEISYEQLLTWDPDYIILASDAVYTVEDVLADPNLTNCSAVKNKNVYKIPGNAEAWDSPVPGCILGSIWLANIIHPDILSDDEFDAVTNIYYATFYGFNYSKN